MIAPMTKAKIAVGLALAFIVLNVLDILLTWYGLRIGAVELNFYMSKVLGLGFFQSIAFKVGVSSGLVAVMLQKGQFNSLLVGVIIIALVCAWNVNVIASLA
jgi:hypothetical protein